MLKYGERGILISVKENRKENKEKGLLERKGEKRVESQEMLNGIVEKLLEIIKDQGKMKRMSIEGQEWSQQYTLEKFESEIKKLL